MIVRPPREPRWVSWLMVGCWTLVIYVTIPLARTIQAYVADTVGRAWFTYGVLAILALTAAAAVRALRRRRERMTWRNLAWLSAVGAVYAGWTVRLGTGSPEEAVHFVEYGVLAVLIFRAFAHSIPDAGVYIASWLLGTFLGGIDELIQWIVPERYFDFRDVWINSASCLLVLAGLSRGLVPAYVRAGLSRASIRRVYPLGAAVLLLLLAFLRNTPAARAAYEQAVPGLASLLRHASAMTQYGYLYDDPDIGRFKSRLSSRQLRETDRARGVEAASALDAYHSPDRYDAFLDLYTVAADSFLHEARVHLFRRDKYRHTAAEHRTTDPGEYRRHLTVAYRENQIMETYFSNTLSHSKFQLKPATVEYLEAEHDPDTAYVSPVSEAVITAFSQRQATGFMIAALLAWTVLCGYAHRRSAGAVAPES